jgi:hypothetical protein
VGKKQYLKLTRLEFSGVSQSMQTQLAREIETAFVVASVIAEKSKLKVGVEVQIWISDDMSKCVEELESEFGISDEVPYKQRRSEIMAGAISLFAQIRPPLLAAIVFDAPLMVESGPAGVAQRWYLIFHEISHVVREAIHRPSTLQPQDPLKWTFRKDIHKLVGAAREEIIVDRLALNCSRMVLQDDAGHPMDSGVYIGPWFANTIPKYLERLCTFSRLRVKAYIAGQVSVEALFRELIDLVREFLITFAHTVVLLSPDDLGILRTKLHEIPGYREYLEEEWDDLIQGLTLKYSAQSDDKAVDAVLSLLAKLGLQYEELPSQQFIYNFLKPILCDDEPPNQSQ